jgi:hypothetical protein
MPMGLVELHGIARTDDPTLAPFTGKPVAFWEVRIEEWRSSRRHSRWVTVHDENSSDHPFYLEDETGRVLVLPDGAETSLPQDYQEQLSGKNLPGEVEAYVDSCDIRRTFLGIGKSLRFTEWHIDVGQEVYVHGIAQERPDLRERQRDRMNELLREIKENPDAMGTLDADGDGQVDDLEWEQARRSAVGQLQAEGITDRVVVASGKSQDLFLISDRSESDLVQRLRWETGLYVFGGGAAFVAGTAYLIHWFGLF